MWVTRVIGDCPSCGGHACFGNVSVGGERVLRGCKHCSYSLEIPLPSIRKKIIYLDQYFYSLAFKGNHSKVMIAVEKIRQLSSLQLLVAPYSTIHEEETHQFIQSEALWEFIKLTSRGHYFEPDYSVEETQMVRAFRTFLNSASSDYQMEERDAFRRNVHSWDDYVFVDVGRYRGDPEELRKQKAQTAKALVDAFDEWRLEKRTFQEDINLELRDAGRLALESYKNLMSRTFQGDFNAVIGLSANLVSILMRYLPDQMSIGEKTGRVSAFFQSGHFAQVPHQRLFANILATLKKKVRDGGYKNKESSLKAMSGFFQDVRHISVFAPYCDAIVVDREMAEMIRRKSVGLTQHYRTKVFSLSNWGEFLNWLDALKAEMNAEHAEAVAIAYPT